MKRYRSRRRRAPGSVLVSISGSVVESAEDLTYRMGVGGAVTGDLSYYSQSPGDMSRWRAKKTREWGRWTKTGTVSAAPPISATSDGREWGRWTKTGTVIIIRWDDSPRKLESWKSGSTRVPVRRIWLQGRFQSVGGSGNSALGGDKQQARYRVDGYSIEFQFPGARPERRWFYRYPYSDRTIGIGNCTYSIRK